MNVVSAKLDRLGMAASTVCAIHCAILPFVLGLLPLIGMGFVAHAAFEWAMISLATVIGFVSLSRGHRIHRKHTAMCFFFPGLFLLLMALMSMTDACCQTIPVRGFDQVTGQMVVIREIPVPQSGVPWRAVVMAVGGFSIAAAHFINMRLCRSCHKCADEAHHRGVA